MNPLVCKCGIDLGIATLATKGLCPNCRRSIWMQVAMRYEPKSQAIADGLNRRFAESMMRGEPNSKRKKHLLCCHQHAPCFSRCGITYTLAGWAPIKPELRQEWLAKLTEPLPDDRYPR